MTDEALPIARFGQFELDTRSGDLTKAGRRIRLRGQPVHILVELLRAHGQVVTRDALQQRLWPADTFVAFDQGLNAAVKRLRAALGDSAEVPRFVETLPRLGYRFIAPIEWVAGAPPAAMPAPSAPPIDVAPAAARRQPPLVAIAVTLVVAVVTAALVWSVRGGAGGGRPQIHALAVLPFQNLTGDPEQEYVADGVTEMLVADLSRLSSVRVISRTSVMRYKGVSRPIAEIARELGGVDAIVEGSVARDGGRVRVTAQLVHAPTDTPLWAESFERDARDLLAVERDLSRAIASAVRATITPHEQARLAVPRPPIGADAHEAYLKGRYFWNQRGHDNILKSMAFFRQALQLEPRYPQAHAALADAYNLLPRYNAASTREAVLNAKAHALHALELDPDLAEAHATLAKAKYVLDWDWTGAEDSFRRALAASPGYATARHWYSIELLMLGRVDEALREAAHARSLDPLSPVFILHEAWLQYLSGRYDDALRGAAATLEIDPGFDLAHALTGWVHLARQQTTEATLAFERAAAVGPPDIRERALIAMARAGAGDPRDARRLLPELTTAAAGDGVLAEALLWVYLALDERDAAIGLLTRSFEDRSVSFFLFDLRYSWRYASVRADPRLTALLESAGLAF